MQYPQLNIVSHRRAKLGFTIVELLIVIVVIAILAAISIVAYTGIQDRARATAATSAARQVADKIAVFAVENDGFPAALSDVGFSDSNGTTYQYRVNNDRSPATWCVTVTAGNKSFYSSSTQGNPKEGACAGHGNAGVAAITNLHPNPGAVTGLGVGSYSGATGSTVSAGPVAASWSGSGSAYRATWTSVGTNTGDGDIAIRLSEAPLQPNTRYTVTFRLRGPNKTSAVGAPTLYSSASGSYTTVGKSPAATQSLASGQIDDRWVTFEATAAGLAGGLRVVQSLSAKLANDYLEVSEIMIYEGNYDSAKTWKWGNSPGWVWNGTPNNSTSTGSPL